ncbi:MAG: hypothetical protein AAF985_25105, partial [Bacteroidota bacterium]
SKCFQVLLFSTLILSLFFACSKEQNDFAPALKSDGLNTSIRAAPRVSPASYKWIKRKADRFDEVLLQLGLQTETDLLNIAGNFKPRLQLAHSNHIDYAELTQMVELADLMRTGMTLIHASLFQSTISNLIELDQLTTLFPKHYQYIQDKEVILNVALFSKIQPNKLLLETDLFLHSSCKDCDNVSAPTVSILNRWIENAQNLEPKITYLQ